jgi:hypothetical protein
MELILVPAVNAAAASGPDFCRRAVERRLAGAARLQPLRHCGEEEANCVSNF